MIIKGKRLAILLAGLFTCLSISYTQSFNEINHNLKGTLYKSIQFTSRIADTNLNYSIYLPPGYHMAKDSFAIVFLLHGVRGDENSWIKSLRIHRLADSLISIHELEPLILVMPEGKNSYYINDYRKSFPYDSIFINDFYPYIMKNYKVNQLRYSRFVAGLSMGGFGAIMLATRNPDCFGGVVALSPAIRTDSMIVNESHKKYNNYFAPLFGDDLQGNDRLNRHWKNNSIFYLLNDSLANNLRNINWYIDCGFDDYLLPGNEALHKLFLSYSIPHEYHVRPGRHERKYWEEGIITWLKYINGKLVENRQN